MCQIKVQECRNSTIWHLGNLSLQFDVRGLDVMIGDQPSIMSKECRIVLMKTMAFSFGDQGFLLFGIHCTGSCGKDSKKQKIYLWFIYIAEEEAGGGVSPATILSQIQFPIRDSDTMFCFGFFFIFIFLQIKIGVEIHERASTSHPPTRWSFLPGADMRNSGRVHFPQCWPSETLHWCIPNILLHTQYPSAYPLCQGTLRPIGLPVAKRDGWLHP